MKKLENIKNFKKEIMLLNSDRFIINYLNNDNKNSWNILCSCMEWQNIAYDNISSYLNDSEDSLHYNFCFKYIQSIDILTETLLQQERILKRKDYKWNPIKDTRKCFKNCYYRSNNEKIRLEVKGNNYDTFKHIRAIFNAHPVNLKNDGERFNASWPFSSKIHNVENGNTKDYVMVYLYPLNINKSVEILYLYKYDLKNYVKYLLNHFEELINYMKKEKKLWIENKKKEIIPKTKNIKEELTLLKKESDERGFDTCQLEQIERIINFKDESNEKLINDYKKEIETLLLPKIREYIQNLDYESNDIYPEILEPHMYVIDEEMQHYYYEKLSDEEKFILPIIIPEIKEKLENIMNFEQNDKDNSFITLKAALYFYNKK